jgi:hypothetical protein
MPAAISVVILVALFVTLIPDHHRRAVVGDRHRRHGPAGALQRAGDVGPRGRGGRRRRYAAARQDRHHHARQPAGDRVRPCAASPSRNWRMPRSWPRWPTRPRRALDRGAGKGEIRHPRPRHGGAQRHLHSVHGANPHERRRCRRIVGPQGRGRCDPELCRWRSAACRGVGNAARVLQPAPVSESRARSGDRGRNRQGRRHAAGGRQGRPPARRHPPQGHRQGRHPRALCRTAPHGHPHRDDHRRQPDDGGGDRGGSRRRRFPRPGDAGRQAEAHPRRAGQGQAGRDVRRRHQRRAGARPGRCRRRHEHRHAGRARGRQHGRSRLQSDQADRGGRDRQAAVDDPRRADHVLDRQRRRKIFRHHPGDVPGVLSAARGAQRHAAGEPAKRDPVGDHLQCADHHRADSAGPEGRGVSRHRRRRAAAPQPAGLWPRRHHHSLYRHQGHRPRRRALHLA